MKRILIFIETRNKSVDYDWFNAENSQLQSPAISPEITKLADTEFESLVLYRQSSQLILAITALKSYRIDNRTRPIRNSLIWIADNDDEAKIRAIIYEYLTAKDKLEKGIAEAITETPEIKIDYQTIKSVGDENKVKNNDLPKSSLAYKIGNLDQYKQDLTKEIEQYNLPIHQDEEGLLIFITDSKSQKTFEEVKPWRGLSNNITSKEWITLGKKTKKPTSQTSPKSLKESEKIPDKQLKNMENKPFNLLSIILAIFLIVSNAFWFYQNNQLNQRINELEKKFNQIETLQLVIDKSKASVETAKMSLENDVLTAKEKFEKAFLQAQEQLNQEIMSATNKYENKMNEVQQQLENSLKQIDSNS